MHDGFVDGNYSHSISNICGGCELKTKTLVVNFELFKLFAFFSSFEIL
jgi:hypothetical protein